MTYPFRHLNRNPIRKSFLYHGSSFKHSIRRRKILAITLPFKLLYSQMDLVLLTVYSKSSPRIRRIKLKILRKSRDTFSKIRPLQQLNDGKLYKPPAFEKKNIIYHTNEGKNVGRHLKYRRKSS